MAGHGWRRAACSVLLAVSMLQSSCSLSGGSDSASYTKIVKNAEESANAPKNESEAAKQQDQKVQEASAAVKQESKTDNTKRYNVPGNNAFYVDPSHASQSSQILSFEILDYDKDGYFLYAYLADPKAGSSSSSKQDAGKENAKDGYVYVFMRYNPLTKDKAVFFEHWIPRSEAFVPRIISSRLDLDSGTQYFFLYHETAYVYNADGSLARRVDLGALLFSEAEKWREQFEKDGKKYVWALTGAGMDEDGSVTCSLGYFLKAEDARSGSKPQKNVLVVMECNDIGANSSFSFGCSLSNREDRENYWKEIQDESYESREDALAAMEERSFEKVMMGGEKQMAWTSTEGSAGNEETGRTKLSIYGISDILDASYSVAGGGQEARYTTNVFLLALAYQEGVAGKSLADLSENDGDRALLSRYTELWKGRNNSTDLAKRDTLSQLWNKLSEGSRENLMDAMKRTYFLGMQGDSRILPRIAPTLGGSGSRIQPEKAVPQYFVRVGSGDSARYLGTFARAGDANTLGMFFVQGKKEVRTGSGLTTETQSYPVNGILYIPSYETRSVAEKLTVEKLSGSGSGGRSSNAGENAENGGNAQDGGIGTDSIVVQAENAELDKTRPCFSPLDYDGGWTRTLQYGREGEGGKKASVTETLPSDLYPATDRIYLPEGSKVYTAYSSESPYTVGDANVAGCFLYADRQDDVEKEVKILKEEYRGKDYDELKDIEDSELYETKKLKTKQDMSTLLVLKDRSTRLQDRTNKGWGISAGLLLGGEALGDGREHVAAFITTEGVRLYTARPEGGSSRQYSIAAKGEFYQNSELTRSIGTGLFMDIGQEEEQGDSVERFSSEEELSQWEKKEMADEGLSDDTMQQTVTSQNLQFSDFLCINEKNVLLVTLKNGIFILQDAQLSALEDVLRDPQYAALLARLKLSFQNSGKSHRVLPLDAGCYYAAFPIQGRDSYMLVGYDNTTYIYEAGDVLFAKCYEKDVLGESLENLMKDYLRQILDSYLTRRYRVETENGNYKVPALSLSEQVDDALSESFFANGDGRNRLQTFLEGTGLRFHSTDGIYSYLDSLREEYANRMQAVRELKALLQIPLLNLDEMGVSQQSLWLRQQIAEFLTVDNPVSMQKLMVQVAMTEALSDRVWQDAADKERYRTYREQAAKQGAAQDSLGKSLNGGGGSSSANNSSSLAMLENGAYLEEVFADIKKYYDEKLYQKYNVNFDNYYKHLMKRLNPDSVIPEEDARNDLVAIINSGTPKLEGKPLESLESAVQKRLPEINTVQALEELIVELKITNNGNYGSYLQEFRTFQNSSFASSKERQAAFQKTQAYQKILLPIKESKEVQDLLKNRAQDWEGELEHIISAAGAGMVLNID